MEKIAYVICANDVMKEVWLDKEKVKVRVKVMKRQLAVLHIHIHEVPLII